MYNKFEKKIDNFQKVSQKVEPSFKHVGNEIQYRHNVSVANKLHAAKCEGDRDACTKKIQEAIDEVKKRNKVVWTRSESTKGSRKLRKILPTKRKLPAPTIGQYKREINSFGMPLRQDSEVNTRGWERKE